MANGLLVTEVQGVTIVNFRDPSILDGATVERLGDDLYVLVDQQAKRKILLDFRQVKFLSSTMMGILLALHNKAVKIKGKVVVCGLQDNLMKVFKVMQLHKVLSLARNEEHAMSILSGRQ